MTKLHASLSLGFIIPPKQVYDQSIDRESQVNAFNAILMTMGYVISEELFDYLKRCSISDIVDLGQEVEKYYREKLGYPSDQSYVSVFKGYPHEVLQASSLSLFVQQRLSYLTGASFSDSSIGTRRQRMPYLEGVGRSSRSLSTIILGTDKDLDRSFIDLCKTTIPLGKDQLKFLKWYMSSNSKPPKGMPKEIPLKTLQMLLLAEGYISVPKGFTTRDILRFAAVISGEEPDNRKPFFRFKGRKIRRKILKLINKYGKIEDMALDRETWKVLFNRLHANEERTKKYYPKAAKLARLIYAGEGKSWYSRVQKAIKENLTLTTKILSERPGEFARTLDELIRKYPSEVDTIFRRFNRVSHKLPTKILIELIEHFYNRKEEYQRTVIINKSLKLLPSLTPLDLKVVNKAIVFIALGLKRKAKQLPKLDGKVWVDPKLRYIALPKNMDSLSDSAKPVTRGSMYPFPDKDSNIVRSYVHWINDSSPKRNHYDIDLHGALFSYDGSKVLKIGWDSHHRDVDALACYSGDVTNRKGPCAEYIDVNISAALKQGYRYLITRVHDYAEEGFSTYTSAVAGMMSLPGEVVAPPSTFFVPESIENSMPLTSNDKRRLAIVVDLQKKVWYPLDAQIKRHLSDEETFRIAKQFSKPPFFSAYDFLCIHAEERGVKRVEQKEHADICFTYDEYAKSYTTLLPYIK